MSLRSIGRREPARRRSSGILCATKLRTGVECPDLQSLHSDVSRIPDRKFFRRGHEADWGLLHQSAPADTIMGYEGGSLGKTESFSCFAIRALTTVFAGIWMA